MDKSIKIERNALDVLEAIVSLSCLVGVSLYLILAWSTIPAQIPAHYNAAGEVNRWGSKSELIVLPIISVLLYGLITLIEHYPQGWNTIWMVGAGTMAVMGGLSARDVWRVRSHG